MKIFHMFNSSNGERATVAAETKEDALTLIGWSLDCIEGDQDAKAILLSRSDGDCRSSDRKETVF
jgi:hypothetical protein